MPGFSAQILTLDVAFVATSSVISLTVDRLFELDRDLNASTSVISDMGWRPERRSLPTNLNPFRSYHSHLLTGLMLHHRIPLLTFANFVVTSPSL